MPRYRITITSKNKEAMLDLVRKHLIEVYDHGIRYSEATGHSVDASAEPADIARLKAAGYQVVQHENIDEYGKARQAEVGRGDRYKPSGQR
jgi:hypothetical protein